MNILVTIQNVFSILLLIAIGYVLSARRWFDEDTAALFSKLVVSLSLPSLIIYNILQRFEKEYLLQMGKGYLAALGIVLSGYIVSILISNWMNVDNKRKGLFRALFTFSNTIFLGMPVCIAIFGDESVTYVLLYYLANTTFFYFAGLYGIKKDHKRGRESEMNFMESIKNLMNPMTAAFLTGILLVILNIKLPVFMMNSLQYLGSLTTPLAMLFIGITVRVQWRQSKEKITGHLNKELLVLMAGKFFVIPFLALGILTLVPLPLLMKKVFLIEAAMPVMTSIAIVCRSYKADYNYASFLIALETVLSLFIIPLYILLMNIW